MIISLGYGFVLLVLQKMARYSFDYAFKVEQDLYLRCPDNPLYNPISPLCVHLHVKQTKKIITSLPVCFCIISGLTKNVSSVEKMCVSWF